MPAKKKPKLPSEYFRFFATFGWDGDSDAVAAAKLMALEKGLSQDPPAALEGIDWDSLQAYYILGERTAIVIGWARSAVALQNFTGFITCTHAIRARVSHLLEIHELHEVGSLQQVFSGST